MIFKLEQHVADYSTQSDIATFLELVIKLNKTEVEGAQEDMKAIAKRFVSLKNGLHHFRHEWRTNLTGRNSTP